MFRQMAPRENNLLYPTQMSRHVLCETRTSIYISTYYVFCSKVLTLLHLFFYIALRKVFKDFLSKTMAARLVARCVHQSMKVPCRASSHEVWDGVRADIGSREVVGYGFNGEPCYIDRTDYPMPAIRWKNNTPDIMALREKEKGDWKKLSIEEKKALYRASFCQTFAEIDAPTGLWKRHIAVSLLVVSGGLMLFIYGRWNIYPGHPESFNKENQLAQLDRMRKIGAGGVTGSSASYNK